MEIEEIGSVCVYCGNETQDMCCGEVHHEMAWEIDGDLVLEHELTEEQYNEINNGRLLRDTKDSTRQ